MTEEIKTSLWLDYRPSESEKSLAKELSILLVSNNGDPARKKDLLDQLRQMPGRVEPRNQQDSPVEDIPERIGIWKRVSRNGTTVYRRDIDKQFEWPLWADVHYINPKGSKRRLVLLGESVARGYLYDPHYNVAKELEAILNSRRETADMEVVDLARTSMIMGGLIEMAKSCIALEPDGVVIFGGNNWDPLLMSSLDQKEQETVLDIFSAEGFPGVKWFIEQKFAKLVSGFLEAVASSLIKKGIPVVFVIPEFNLKDWKSDRIEQGLIWLPDREMEKWLLAKETARRARSQNNVELFGAAAGEMVTINPSNPLGHELLGDFHLLKEQYGEARHDFEFARDLVLFTGGTTRPRCYKVIRDRILTEAPGLGITIVDLPAIFEREFPDHIPDRDQFLDYCHLTVEGIKLAMRYTAQTITALFTGELVPIATIRASDLCPANHILAIAHFGAAIHNAHNGQPAEILHYHCSKAIGHSLKLKDTMLEFVDFSTRQAPSFFCRSFEKIIFGGQMRQYEGAVLTLSHPARRKLMDIELVNAIAAALHTVNIDADEEIDRLRTREHGIGAEAVDLLESFYSAVDYNQYVGEQTMLSFRSRTTESHFNFIVRDNGGRVAFKITCRTPGREDSSKFIRIHANGEKDCVSEIPMSSGWASHSFALESGRLKKGVNSLVIHWPYTFQPLSVENNTSHYSITKTLYPVLGEIFSFLAVSNPLPH